MLQHCRLAAASLAKQALEQHLALLVALLGGTQLGLQLVRQPRHQLSKALLHLCLALFGRTTDALQLRLEGRTLLLSHFHLSTLLFIQAAEQLVQALTHATDGSVHVSRRLLHLQALLTAHRGHAVHEITHQLFQHLRGLLAGGADQGLNGWRHYVVQGIGQRRLHRFAHAIERFLQTIANTLVQLLQRFLALLAVLGDMHQRLLGGDAWVEEVDIVLQLLDLAQR